MSKVFVAFGLVVAALAGTVAAQGKPNFSGRFELAPDKSTPPGSPGVFGKSLRLQQTETTLTVESTVMVLGGSIVNGQPLRSEQIEATLTSTYAFDGAEHELQRSSTLPQRMPVGASVTSYPPPMTYRAIWTTNQLVILTTTKAGPSSTTDTPGTLQRLTQVSLSFDSDGSLVVDSIAIAAPRAGAAKQNPPVPSRSVYVKKN